MLDLAGGRTREGIGDRVEQGLDAPHLGRRAAEDRDDLAVDDALVERLHRLVAGDLFLGEELLHQFLACLRDRLEEGGAELLDIVVVLFGNVKAGVTAALGIEHIHHAVDQVGEPDDLVAVDHRDLHRADGDAELVVQGVEDLFEPRLVIVEAVDKERLRDLGVGGKVPRQLGPDLDPRLTVDDDHGCVGDAGALTDLALEIEVARGVHQVDLDPVPGDRRERRGKRKAAADLLGVVVADRIPRGHRAEPVGILREVEHRLGKRGLTAPSVSE